MYKHIMIPTDGSPLSEDAAHLAIELAREIDARVTVLHVLPEPESIGLEGWSHHDPEYAKHLAVALERHGEQYVDSVREEARLAGVRCDAMLTHAGSTAGEIITRATEKGCDLIVMASHGRKGADGVLLASVTVAVATLGKIPVLIHHRARPS